MHAVKPDTTICHADPIMVVTLGDEVHRVRVKPGEEGQREFQKEIRRLFQIPDEVEFEVRLMPVAGCAHLGTH